ncbi:sulfite exporter TauE/SafE family protein [Ramlibacter sp.]|uniref:sulfite exporter TauE/SafE family protein n=1 Tax=Ramlibacter sp. TaxID=1917967 RepID=UPI003D0CB9F7
MGIAGAPHCAAMCGAACAGVTRLRTSRPRRTIPIAATSATSAPGVPDAPDPLRGDSASSLAPMLQFQAGRLAGYAAAGAAVGAAAQSFAWLNAHTAALRPVWTLLHLAILAWGLALLVLAREPAWVGGVARAVWTRVRPVAQARHGVFGIGALWVLMPCGLLYSALVIASVAGGPLEGATAMALFALGSGTALGLFPPLLARLRQDWGTRAGGALLAGTAAWALWSDALHRIAVWCGLA